MIDHWKLRELSNTTRQWKTLNDFSKEQENGCSKHILCLRQGNLSVCLHYILFTAENLRVIHAERCLLALYRVSFLFSTFILKLLRLELSSLCLRSEELIGYFATVEVRTDMWMFGDKINAYSQIFKQIAIFYGFI